LTNGFFNVWKKYILPVIVGISIVYSLVQVLKPLPEPISDETWDAVEKIVEADAWASEPVIVHPVWENSAYQRFKKHQLYMGKPTNEGIYNYPRVWMVIARGAGDTDYLEQRFMQVFEQQVGEVVVKRYEKPEVEGILFEFFSNISKAEVRLTNKKGQVRPCKTFRNLRWFCPIRDWNNVGQATVQVRNKWETGIWMHPIKDWVTEAAYKNVPMGKRIKGEFALADPAIKKLPNGAKVNFRILIDGKEVGKYSTRNRNGWQPFQIDTSKMEGKTATVTFQADTKRDGMRHFCWRAQVRADVPEKKKTRSGKSMKPAKDSDKE